MEKSSALFSLLPYSLLKDNASEQKGEIFNLRDYILYDKKLQGLPLPCALMHLILWHCAFNFLQVAFKTGDYKQQVIFIGGLTDGFLATEYVAYYIGLNISQFHLPSVPLFHSLLHFYVLFFFFFHFCRLWFGRVSIKSSKYIEDKMVFLFKLTYQKEVDFLLICPCLTWLTLDQKDYAFSVMKILDYGLSDYF